MGQFFTMSCPFKNPTLISTFLFLTVIIRNYHQTHAQASWDRTSDYFPKRCENFVDSRAAKKDDSFLGGPTLEVPPHLTSGKDKGYTFRLADQGYFRNATVHEENCQHPEMFEMSLIPSGFQGAFSTSYPFQDQWKYDTDTYFTADGYLHRKSRFLTPGDYCVQSISDKVIAIKTCQVNCSADLSNNELQNRYRGGLPYEISRLCIPKCCGIDETLEIGSGTCRKLNDTEPTYFIPYLHLPQPIWFLKESKESVKHRDIQQTLVFPVMSRKRASWNSTHSFYGGSKSLWGNLQFYRSKVNCSKYIWRGLDTDDVRINEEDKKMNKKYNFRLEVAPGMVKLAFLTRSRKWIGYQNEFCVDGLDGWGEGVTDKPVNEIVLTCVDDNQMDTKKYAGEVKVGDKSSDKTWPGLYLYLAILIFCDILLLFGFWMYGLAWPKLNFNGRLIACHLRTLAFSYLFRCVAIAASSEHSRVGSNAEIVVSSDFDGDRRVGWACVGLGVICHYFYLSVFFWLSVLNGEFRKFWGNVVLGWGIPVILVVIFCAVDALYNDPWSEAVVPDYGVESCGVASWSAGYYIQLPVGILLGLSALYILAKLIAKLRGKEDEDGAKFSGMIPFKLFVTIWCVQTVAWIATVTEWALVYNEHEYNWARTCLQIFGILLETFVLLHCYCMNEVILGLAGERVSVIQAIMKFLKRNKLCWKGSGPLGRICANDSDDDTVVVEGDVLMTR